MTEIKDKDLEKAAGGAMKRPRPGNLVAVDPEGSCENFHFGLDKQYETEHKCKNCYYFVPGKNWCNIKRRLYHERRN